MFKLIASNTTAQLVAKFFGAGLTLLSTYFIIRLSGLSLYGDYTKVVVLVAVGFTLIDFGLNAEAIRRHTPTPLVILTRLFLSCLVLVILNLFINFLGGGYSPSVKGVFWLGSLAIIFQGIYTSTNAYFQAQLSYWRSTLAVIVGSLFGTLLTLYFLFQPAIVQGNILAYLILANTLGYLLIAACSLLLLPRTQFENWRIIDLRLVLPLLRRALPLGGILIASVLASKIDTIILGIYRTSSEVGAYGFAYRIFDVTLVVPVFIMNSLYPLLLQHQSGQLLKKTLITLGSLGLLAGIVLYLLAPLITLIRPELFPSIPILRTLALSSPLFYLTAPLMWQLIATQKDHFVLATYCLAALFNLVVNLTLIPSFGAPAAAITTGVTELFIFLSLLYFFRNNLRA